MGGSVHGGLFGTAASLSRGSAEPDAREQRAATSTSKPISDRSTRKVIDNWLGGDSVGVLGDNFRKSGLDFVLTFKSQVSSLRVSQLQLRRRSSVSTAPGGLRAACRAMRSHAVRASCSAASARARAAAAALIAASRFRAASSAARSFRRSASVRFGVVRPRRARSASERAEGGALALHRQRRAAQAGVTPAQRLEPGRAAAASSNGPEALAVPTPATTSRTCASAHPQADSRPRLRRFARRLDGVSPAPCGARRRLRARRRRGASFERRDLRALRSRSPLLISLS